MEQLTKEASDTDHGLKRTLGPLNLTTLGVGAIIGAGIFVLTGQAAAQYAGPAIVLSFVVSGLGCAFAGLCYAEFAAMIPIAGSAYTYAYATMKELANAEPEDLFPFVHGITNFRHKSGWLVSIAEAVKDDEHIPITMEELTKLPGIGRKSANVIIGESGGKAEGVIVDLHVARVAPRLGITKSDSPDKIEKDIMESIAPKYWHAAGMGMTFLGREVCRPKNPKCPECVVRDACGFYRKALGSAALKRRHI